MRKFIYGLFNYSHHFHAYNSLKCTVLNIAVPHSIASCLRILDCDENSKRGTIISQVEERRYFWDRNGYEM